MNVMVMNVKFANSTVSSMGNYSFITSVNVPSLTSFPNYIFLVCMIATVELQKTFLEGGLRTWVEKPGISMLGHIYIK